MIRTAKGRILAHIVAQLHSVVVLFLHYLRPDILAEVSSLYVYPLAVYLNPILIFMFVESLFRFTSVKKTEVTLSERLASEKSKSFAFTGIRKSKEWANIVLFFGTLVTLLFLHGGI